MSSKQVIRLVDEPDLFWEGIDTLKTFYQSSHYLFMKRQIEYRRQRLIDDKINFNDLSFALFESGTPYYAFIGFKIQYTIEGSTQYKVNSGELPSSSLENITISNNQKKVIASELDKILLESDTLEYLELFPRPTVSTTAEYLLQRPNSEANLRFNCLIDLKKTENELKIEIRRRYRSLINWGEKNLEFILIHRDHLQDKSYAQFLEYRELHYQSAGRRTRSKKTWDIQFKCIEEGSIFAIFGYLDGRMVTGGLFNVSDSYVYYANSASNRDLFDKPIFHALFWRAIQYSKDLGASIFDTGEIYIRSQTNYLQKSEKELNISRFKSGFGGGFYQGLKSKASY